MALSKNSIKVTLLFSVTLGLTACSSSKQSKLDYRTPGATSHSDRLLVPPDLTGVVSENRYELPKNSGSVRASELNNSTQLDLNSKVVTKIENVHIEKSGSQRWLVIDNKNPEEIWPLLNAFWQEMGFVIDKEQPQLGLMETQWAENRAAIPSDPLRNFFDKVGLGSIYSSSLRDKFIIRVENEKNGSNVTFTHRGQEEVFVGRNKETTRWQARKSDPNLEAQFLARFMMKLGLNEKEVAAKIKSPSSINELATLNDHQLIIKGDNRQRNVYRLRLALDRIGLTVLEENNQGFIVSPALASNNSKTEEKGALSRLFKSKKNTDNATQDQPREKIIIKINKESNGDGVKVYNENNQEHKNQGNILKQLYNELR